jgi:hypothetical protein
MEKPLPGETEPNCAGLKEKLQTHTRGNQVEGDFDHIKCIL